MKKRLAFRRVLSSILSFSLIMGDIPMLPTMIQARAQEPEIVNGTSDDPITYIDEYDDEQTLDDYYVLTGTEAVNVDDGMIHLSGGTYVVIDDVTYQDGLHFGGETKLILCDGKTLTINTDDVSGICADRDLRIYGQDGDTGKLVVNVDSGYEEDCGIKLANSDLYCYGGCLDINADEGIYSFCATIKGGSVSFGADTDTHLIRTIRDLEILGGKISTAGAGSFCTEQRDIVIGYNDADDYIEFGAGGVSADNGSVSVDTDLRMIDAVSNIYTDTLTSEQVNELGGKRLIPASEYTVTFMDGESVYKVSGVSLSTNKVLRPADPQKETDIQFLGWYPIAFDKGKFNFDTEIYGNITLYAAWNITNGYCGDPDVNAGHDVTWELSDNEAVPGKYTLTISGSGAMADYYSAVEIPWNAFGKDITKVVIGGGITAIGTNAFRICESLTGITFEDGSELTKIGDYAFYKCSGITSIVFPKKLSTIGESAFEKCAGLAEITFEEGSELTEIGDWAFYECSGITSIVFPEKLSTIGNNAFDNSCLTDVTIHKGLKEIGNNALESIAKVAIHFIGSGKEWHAIKKNGVIASDYTVDYSEGVDYFITFKVQNGYWNDNESGDITIEKYGDEGEILKLTEEEIPAVGAKPKADYKEGAWDIVPVPDSVVSGSATYTYYYQPDIDSVNVTFKVKNGSWDDGTKEDKVLPVIGIRGKITLTPDQLPAVGSKPDKNYYAGKWDDSILATTLLSGGETITYVYEKGSDLGADAIMKPAVPGTMSAANSWGGGYVYYGSYQAETQSEATPVKYRVLDNNADKFGGHTMLLDCDTVLFKSAFNPQTGTERNIWKDSIAYKALNTDEDSFLNTAFTAAEQAAIANSTIASHAYTSIATNPGDVAVDANIVTKCKNYTALTGEKIFLLDIEDVSNIAYGYSVSYINAEPGRIKSTLTTEAAWRLRSSYISNKNVFLVTAIGKFYSQNTGNIRGMSPALNIDLSSVIKTTPVSSEPGAYKLMITDNDLGIALTEDSSMTLWDGKVTVSFSITDSSETATPERVSVIVTNGSWGEDGWSEGADLLQYAELDMDSFALTGEGVFTLDQGISGEWGKDYHVYLIAEDINGEKETDYASAPLEMPGPQIKKGISANVCFKVVNGSWDDGTTEDKTVTLRGDEGDVLKLSAKDIPSAGTKPDAGYMAGSWDVMPVADTVITADTVYTYSYTNKQVATITTAPAAKTLTYNGSAQELVTAGVASGGTMVYSLNANGTYSATIPSKKDAGSYTVYYKVSGDSSHADSAAESVNVSIARKAVTVTADNKSKTYGAADPALTATVSGTIGSDTVTYSLSRAEGNAVGTYTITVTGSAIQGNYNVSFTNATFTINKVAATVTKAPAAKTLTYNGNAQELVSAGTANGGTLVYSMNQNGTYSAAIPSKKDAGTYKVYYKVAGDSNHIDSTSGSVDVTIARKAATVTADNKSKTCGEVDPALTATVNGTVGTDTLTYSISREAGEAVGTYVITVTGAAVQGNYDVAYTNGTFTIVVKAITPVVSVSQNSYIYDGTAKTPEVTVKDGSTVLAATEYTVTYASNVNAGTADVTVSANSISGAYSFDPVTVHFTIAKAALSVSANANTIVYGDVPAAAGVTYTGFVNGEGAAVLSGNLAYDYSYAQYGNVGDTYTITPKGLTSGNYEISYIPGKLSVLEKEVGISWGETSLIYNGEAQAPAATATGLVNNDKVGVTVSGAQTEVGLYTATAAALTGDKAANYKLPAENTVSFTISRETNAEYTEPTANESLVYDGTGQKLITAGTVSGCSVVYAIGADGLNAPEKGWDSVIPTAVHAGEYHVWYKVTENDNNETIAVGCVKVSIGARTLSVSANAQIIDYGMSISEDKAQVTVEGLAAGDSLISVKLTQSTVNATEEGSITAGDAVINNGTTDVTADYSISYIAGKLIINRVKWERPEAPEVESVSTNFVVLKAVENAEYRCDEAQWQDSNIFEGLKPGTSYSFRIRIKEDANHIASDISPVKVVVTEAAASPITDEDSTEWAFLFENGETSYSTTYTGAAIRPKVLIYSGTKLLKEGVDYSLTYSKNTTAGTATVNVKGSGNYRQTHKMEFTILPKAIADENGAPAEDIVVDGLTVKGTASPKIKLYYNGKALQTRYYGVTVSDDDTVTISSRGVNLTGTIEGLKVVRIADPGAFNQAKIKVTFTKKKYIYNGQPQLPTADELKVTDAKGTSLIEGTDYLINYSGDTVNAGKVSFTVIGIGKYVGSVSKSYTIAAAKNAQINVELIPEVGMEAGSYSYNKAGAKPGVVVTAGSDGDNRLLTEGVDYSVVYGGSRKAGSKGKIKLTMLGNYRGAKPKAVAFNVVKASFEQAVVYAGDMIYSKAGKNYPKNVMVTINGVIVPSSEYSITYSVEGTGDNKITLGDDETEKTVTVTVTSKGKNYMAGQSVEGTYRILKSNVSEDVTVTEMSGASVKIVITGKETTKKNVEYTGRPITFDPEDEWRQADIMVKKGKLKIKGADVFRYFDVSYANNIESGTATIILTAKEKLDDGKVNPYTGMCKGTFKIKSRSVK